MLRAGGAPLHECMTGCHFDVSGEELLIFSTSVEFLNSRVLWIREDEGAKKKLYVRQSIPGWSRCGLATLQRRVFEHDPGACAMLLIAHGDAGISHIRSRHVDEVCVLSADSQRRRSET